MFKVSFVALRRGAGIVGLPNVGKSTLFNAMTSSQQAKTGNYPFCTIDANLSKVSVFDERLRTLQKFAKSETVVDVEIDLADVAGLIEGASKGAGLGNKFLADIRPCTIILHMVRCFESAKDGFDAPDPLKDIDTIVNELIIADIEAMEKRYQKMRSKKAGDPEAVFQKRLIDWLSDGKPANAFGGGKLTAVEQDNMKQYQLLSIKPMMYVLNIDEDSVITNGNKFSKAVEEKFGEDSTCKVCSVIEEQTSQFGEEERFALLQEYGLQRPMTEVLLRKAYKMLKLQSFFTIGPIMSHGWAITEGTTAKEAAGEIHGDFTKYFESAKVCPWDKFVTYPNLKSAEDNGFVKVDGKYPMKDGDVFLVEHSASRK